MIPIEKKPYNEATTAVLAKGGTIELDSDHHPLRGFYMSGIGKVEFVISDDDIRTYDAPDLETAEKMFNHIAWSMMV